MHIVVIIMFVLVTFLVPSQYTGYYHTLINWMMINNFCKFLLRCTWKSNVDSIIVCWSHNPGLQRTQIGREGMAASYVFILGVRVGLYFVFQSVNLMS